MGAAHQGEEEVGRIPTRPLCCSRNRALQRSFRVLMPPPTYLSLTASLFVECLLSPNLGVSGVAPTTHSSCADGEVREAVAGQLLAFWQFFHEHAGAARGALTVRDLLAWAEFVSAAAPAVGALAAYAHGAHLALLDGIGLGLGVPLEVRRTLVWAE